MKLWGSLSDRYKCDIIISPSADHQHCCTITLYKNLMYISDRQTKENLFIGMPFDATKTYLFACLIVRVMKKVLMFHKTQN